MEEILAIEVYYKEKLKLYKMPEHFHNELEIYYIDNGKVNVYVEGKKNDAEQGDLLFFESGQRHSMEGNPKFPINIINIIFKVSDNSSLIQLFRVIKKKKIKISEKIRSVLDDMLRESKLEKIENKLVLKSKLIELVVELSRQVKEKKYIKLHAAVYENYNKDLISKVKAYLDRNFRMHLTITNISKKFGYNLSYLCRIFKKQTGMTITEYLTGLKIKDAKYLLRKSQLNVTQIAEKLGYLDIHHFSHKFKKIVGLSPMKYSRSLK